MWVASKLGFFSIVLKDGFYHVRGRVKADLVELKRAARLKVKIETWPQADYRWRLRLQPEQLGRVFAALEASVTYPNFKKEIAAQPGQRDKLRAYEDLWVDLARLQSMEEVPKERRFEFIA